MASLNMHMGTVSKKSFNFGPYFIGTLKREAVIRIANRPQHD